MARVRMRHYISGGRQVDLENHTFADWPPAGGILECGEQEAADLVRGGMADPVEEDLPPDIQAVVDAARAHPENDQPRPARAERAARSQPAAGDDTQEPATSAQRLTAPRPKAAAKP